MKKGMNIGRYEYCRIVTLLKNVISKDNIENEWHIYFIIGTLCSQTRSNHKIIRSVGVTS